MSTIEAVVFDLGGVLIDWNPRYLYRKIFDKQEDIDYFLEHICTPDWNEQQDAGRALELATDILVAEHPRFKHQIEAFYGRWPEMLGGPIDPMVEILKKVVEHSDLHTYALTNWSDETFPIAQERYEFLDWFEDIIISGVEKCKKPDKRIYEILIKRTDVRPNHTLFIDDSKRNIDAAQALGFQVFHFDDRNQTDKVEARIFS